MLQNAFQGFFVTAEKPRLGLYVIVAAGLGNILLDTLFVAVFKWGLAGAALATTLAQGICVLIGVIHVKGRSFPFDFKPGSFKIVKAEARELLHVGLPIALQGVLVMFSFIILEGIVNRFGLDASAAAGILDKIFLFATIPTNAFNAAISAMVAQNVGANEHGRAMKCLWYGSILSVAFAAVFFLLGWLIPDRMVGIFTTDTGVISAGTEYYAGYKYEYLLCALAFCVNGFINGTGHTKLTLANNIISTYVVRIPGCILLGVVAGYGLYGIGYALPVASAAQVIVGFGFFFTASLRASRVGPERATDPGLEGLTSIRALTSESFKASTASAFSCQWSDSMDFRSIVLSL